MKDAGLQEKKAPGLDALIEQFKAMPAEELKQILHEEVQRTSASLLRQAASYHVLEQAGEKPQVSAPLRLLYRNIIGGKWSPDLYVRFGGEPYVFDRLKGRPLAEQEEALKLSDADINERLRGRGREEQPAPRRPRPRGYENAAADKKGRPCLADIARQATPKDLADMCLEMVKASPEPQLVARLLRLALDGIDAAPAPKTLAG